MTKINRIFDDVACQLKLIVKRHNFSKKNKKFQKARKKKKYEKGRNAIRIFSPKNYAHSRKKF